ncbi:zeta toxin family protein [Methylotetracoccus oryzae]|uniref:zeta toxin family protein n=1 Tax=Methylotetracoccus oryzae TaxID=1919059 RepID=UPI00111981D3|nr:zeta toxin family protein [Methylotetracoccus oryzae]
MTYSKHPAIAGDEQLRKLRTALAIAQGTHLLPALQQEAEATVSHDQTKRVTYLTALFSRIHRELFHHWKEQATASHRPGTMTESAKRKLFRKTIARLVYDDEQHAETALFDNNGFVIETRNIAERLADFYENMRQVRPFTYGNRITLDFFITALGRLPAFRAVYEQGIDFRRIEARDAVALHDHRSRREDLIAAFEHALDPSRNRRLPNQPNGYGKWPEHKRFVTGIPFLFHRTAEGLDCLVLVNGGLVPVDCVNDELFSSETHFADYPCCDPARIVGYLPGTENLRAAGKTEIDGITLPGNGSAPLFCLDVNMMTGLRAQSHTEVLELLKQCGGEQATIFDIATNSALKRKLLSSAADDPRLQRGVEIAHERLLRTMRILHKEKEAIFAGKTPTANPTLFMCMGGAGSGKTAVEQIAQAQCGENFVIASLDEFRKKSDLYQVLTAANHHSDDYVYIEPFANRLRDLVANQARIDGINLLYDGTGIPYRPRYARIIEKFHDAGFHTHMIAVDAFIVKPEGREGELVRSTVIDSVKERYERTGRALPWVVTVYKHIRAPESFLSAVEDEALSKISLFANDGERNRHYLVAESFACSEEQVTKLQDSQLHDSLAPLLRMLSATHADSIWRAYADGDATTIDDLIARNPGLRENNVGYLVYPMQHQDRVLAIYNVARMIDFVEKRQLNPNASGGEGLLHKPETLAFDVDPLAPEPCTIRLQGSLAS